MRRLCRLQTADIHGGLPAATEIAAIYYGNYLAGLSFFLGFASGTVHLHSRGIFLREQIVDFGASRAEISVAFSVATAAGALFAPLLGYLLDRYPVRRAMIVGAIWMGAGFLVMSRVSTLVQFAVATALFVGLGTGSIGTTASSKLMVDWFDRRRGLALSIAITGYSVAGIVMAPLALHLLEQLGWRNSYLLFGGVLLLLVLPLVTLLVRQHPTPAGAARPEHPSNGLPRGSPLQVFLDFARSPAFWIAASIFGLMAAVYGGLNLHLFLHFTDRGISAWHAASILSVEGAFALGSKPLTGWAIDRYGARQATVAALGGCLIALLVLLATSSFLGALAAGALLGLSFGSLIPLQAALLSRLFGAERFARAYGSLRLATFPLTVTCPLLIGYVHDLRGSYAAAFALFALLFAIALIAAWLLGTRVRSQISDAVTAARE